jgi:thiol-disulfide isomerase/thioredoxin
MSGVLCSAWLTVLAAAWVAASALALPPAYQPAAPDVELRDGEGRRVRLSEFRGRIVLLDLWASWCPPCRSSFPALDALHREYRSRGVQIVAVNLDEQRRDADAFLDEHPHEMLVLFDPSASVLKAFRAPGVPSSYLIDRQGRIRHTHAGYTAATLERYRRQLDALLAEPAADSFIP